MGIVHTLPSQVYWMIGAITGLLILASIVTMLMRHVRPNVDYTELRNRTRTWWVLVLLFTGSLMVGDRAMIVLLGFMSFLAFKEYLSLIPTRRADHRVLFWAYLSIPVQYYWVGIHWYGMFIIFIPVYMFLLLPARMIMIGQTKGFLHAVGTIQWGLMFTVYFLSHLAFLLVLESPDHLGVSIGPGLLMMLVFLTQFNDVAQYVWGKLLGRVRVAPTVSPGKTLAGLLGGIATTVAIAIALGPWLVPIMNWRHAAVLGLIIGVGGFLGDLTLSAVKRDLGVKDCGSMLPGHGGILDRVDSLTYTAPLFFHFVHYCFG